MFGSLLPAVGLEALPHLSFDVPHHVFSQDIPLDSFSGEKSFLEFKFLFRFEISFCLLLIYNIILFVCLANRVHLSLI
jgi:hypothetical protein